MKTPKPPYLLIVLVLAVTAAQATPPTLKLQACAQPLLHLDSTDYDEAVAGFSLGGCLTWGETFYGGPAVYCHAGWVEQPLIDSIGYAGTFYGAGGVCGLRVALGGVFSLHAQMTGLFGWHCCDDRIDSVFTFDLGPDIQLGDRFLLSLEIEYLRAQIGAGLGLSYTF